jgi:N-acetyl-anhydromuramyl-L-alanine amidase AmpD
MKIEHCPSGNFDERPEGTSIDTVVLHATVLDSLEEVIRHFSNPSSKVSAHYTYRARWNDCVSCSREPESLACRSIQNERRSDSRE